FTGVGAFRASTSKRTAQRIGRKGAKELIQEGREILRRLRLTLKQEATRRRHPIRKRLLDKKPLLCLFSAILSTLFGNALFSSRAFRMPHATFSNAASLSSQSVTGLASVGRA